jgi:hypothetical protein
MSSGIGVFPAYQIQAKSADMLQNAWVRRGPVGKWTSGAGNGSDCGPYHTPLRCLSAIFSLILGYSQACQCPSQWVVPNIEHAIPNSRQDIKENNDIW